MKATFIGAIVELIRLLDFPDPSSMLPPRVTTKLMQQQQAALARGRRVSMDDKMFYFRRSDCIQGWTQRNASLIPLDQLYIDDKGVGAKNVDSRLAKELVPDSPRNWFQTWPWW